MTLLYLASTSPRRRQLLTDAAIPFALCAPGPEDWQDEQATPAELALARARRKAFGAEAPDPAAPVLGVDTVVDLAGRELGKPKDRDEARSTLEALAGQRHLVHTAHCLVRHADGHPLDEVATSVVECRVPSAEELERYLASEEWRGKAGSYGIQDAAQSFLTLAEGAFDTVVGLHLDAVRRLLAAMGET